MISLLFSWRCVPVSRICGFVILVLGWPSAFAQSKSPQLNKAASDGFTLSDLLPTPWQKNPRLFFMVVTEVSNEGKERPEVTPEHPVYFQLRNSGYNEIGDAGAGEKTLSAEQVEPLLISALAVNGYLPVQPGQNPTLLITYRWGLHSELDSDTLDKRQITRNRIDRAIMIGGETFSKDLAQAYRETELWRTPPGLPTPLDILRMRDSKTELMVDRSETDIYYVVASAYDYSSMTSGRPVHLWRTRITVPTAGILQRETLPAMIATVGPFFGKETKLAESVTRRKSEGRVEIGTAVVIEPDATPPAPPSSAK